MDAQDFLPLLLPLVAWPVARSAAPKQPPQFASWLLTATGVTLAAGSTTTLVILAFAGLSVVPAIAGFGEWSPDTLRQLNDVNMPVDVGCGIALLLISGSVLVSAVRYLRWARKLHGELDGHSPEAGVIVLPGAEPLAVAVPGRGGRIAVSSGMLAALTPPERCALLAHERTHLRCRHHVFLAAVAFAAMLNPLLRPVRSSVVFALERWADEAAAERVGDRRIVASAVAKAALVSRRHESSTLAATGGPVPRRVSALLSSPSPRPVRSIWLSMAGAGAAVVIGVTGWSVVAAVDAANDLHTRLEVAQAARCPVPHRHEIVLGKGTDAQAALAALPEHHWKCPQR
jgi:Zn-dependent protease with chaperone function